MYVCKYKNWTAFWLRPFWYGQKDLHTYSKWSNGALCMYVAPCDHTCVAWPQQQCGSISISMHVVFYKIGQYWVPMVIENYKIRCFQKKTQILLSKENPNGNMVLRFITISTPNIFVLSEQKMPSMIKCKNIKQVLVDICLWTSSLRLYSPRGIVHFLHKHFRGNAFSWDGHTQTEVFRKATVDKLCCIKAYISVVCECPCGDDDDGREYVLM